MSDNDTDANVSNKDDAVKHARKMSGGNRRSRWFLCTVLRATIISERGPEK